MITSNNAEEIIAECKSKDNPAMYLEIYVKHLCRWIEIQDERIEWHQEQLKHVYKEAK